MFERIVATVDNDAERAGQVLEASQELGQALHSEVLVVHIREVKRPAAVIAATGKPGALPPLVHLEEEGSAEQLVRTAVTRLQRAGVNAQGQVGPGAGLHASRTPQHSPSPPRQSHHGWRS